MTRPVRIGAVRYLNSKPLIFRLEEYAPWAELRLDVPSRLADDLAAGELDVALIPSIEYFRQRRGQTSGAALTFKPCAEASASQYAIVPGMAIAAHGPVLSVKLYCRVPVPEIRTVALDEGSRTSVALTKILLDRWAGLRPITRPLPLGMPAEETDADAVLVIGDRAIQPLELGQVATFDLGEAWLRATGLPFVFAMWVARRDIELVDVAAALRQAKASGLANVSEIATLEGPRLGLAIPDAIRYLTENIRFDFGPRELEGLELFYDSAVKLDLAPAGVPIVFWNEPDVARVR